jgi:hypothetical protein
MATTKTEAQKVEALRKQAQDKSLPQEVRDMADKKANEIEGRSVKKATGIELAKGGAVKKKPADKAADKPMGKGPALVIAVGMGKPMDGKKKMMMGGMAEKTMMSKGGDTKKMMMGGAVAKDLPMRGQRTATNMAKGGSAAKKAKK